MADEIKKEIAPPEATNGEAKQVEEAAPPSEVTDPNGQVSPALLDAIRLAMGAGGDPTIRQVLVQQQRSTTVNINVLLQSAPAPLEPEARIRYIHQVFDIVGAYDTKRLENLQKTVNMGIDAKMRDPDEVEKRRDLQHRRGLGSVVSMCAFISLCAAVFVAVKGGSLVTASSLAILSVILLGFVTMLASGGALTGDNMVDIIRGVQRFFSEENDNVEREPPRDDRRGPTKPGLGKKRRDRTR